MNRSRAAPKPTPKPSVGSLFAGIGGFDLGFEQAGYATAWQVEIEPHLRAVLALRFPHARQLVDVREVAAHNLTPVDVLVGGFPCQDVSSMGARAGLAGARTGLFWQVCRHRAGNKELMLLIESLGKIYYCPLKANRQVDGSGCELAYRRVDELRWSQFDLSHGKLIKIRGFPKQHK